MLKIALLTSRDYSDDPIHNFFQHGGLSLGPFYLESYLEKYGPKADIFLVDTLEDALTKKPDLIGLSSVTQNFSGAENQAKKIKETLGIPVVVGGPHITSLPESLGESMDVGVIGEGEETFRQLVQCLQDGRWGPDAWSKIDGLVYREGEEITKTPPRKPILPLDRIPKPRRAAWAKNLGIAHIMSARGCPYSCSFCTESTNVSMFRSFSVPVIVEEIKDLVDNFKVKSIRFFDDVFNINLKRIQNLAEALRAEGLTEEVSFGAWSRANTLTAEMLKAMQSMNMKYLAFGFESGSDRILSKLKTATQVSDNQRVIQMCNEAGVFVSSTYIIGTPGETEEDLDQTYDFINSNKDKLIDIEITPILPLPGSALWEWALEKGYVTTTMSDWTILRDQAHLPCFNPDHYIYMNEAMTYDHFVSYVKKFAGLWQSFVQDPRVKEAAQVMFPNLQQAQLRESPQVAG